MRLDGLAQVSIARNRGPGVHAEDEHHQHHDNGEQNFQQRAHQASWLHQAGTARSSIAARQPTATGSRSPWRRSADRDATWRQSMVPASTARTFGRSDACPRSRIACWPGVTSPCDFAQSMPSASTCSAHDGSGSTIDVTPQQRLRFCATCSVRTSARIGASGRRLLSASAVRPESVDDDDQRGVELLRHQAGGVDRGFGDRIDQSGHG